MKGVKPILISDMKQTGKNARDALHLLPRFEKAVYARGVDICMYVGPDRFDIQFATKQLASNMAHARASTDIYHRLQLHLVDGLSRFRQLLG